jgi:hypothetical protein
LGILHRCLNNMKNIKFLICCSASWKNMNYRIQSPHSYRWAC